MRLRHQVSFDVMLGLERSVAIPFVRDAYASLSHADFLHALRRTSPSGIEAELPVNAALFGQQRLRFQSRVVPTPDGARLVGSELQDEPGWARVSGEAHVSEHPGGCRVDYRFDIEIHLALPEPEKWGGRALMKMIEVTAESVLARISGRFPAAVTDAAREYEAAFV